VSEKDHLAANWKKFKRVLCVTIKLESEWYRFWSRGNRSYSK